MCDRSTLNELLKFTENVRKEVENFLRNSVQTMKKKDQSQLRIL